VDFLYPHGSWQVKATKCAGKHYSFNQLVFMTRKTTVYISVFLKLYHDYAPSKNPFWNNFTGVYNGTGLPVITLIRPFPFFCRQPEPWQSQNKLIQSSCWTLKRAWNFELGSQSKLVLADMFRVPTPGPPRAPKLDSEKKTKRPPNPSRRRAPNLITVTKLYTYLLRCNSLGFFQRWCFQKTSHALKPKI